MTTTLVTTNAGIAELTSILVAGSTKKLNEIAFGTGVHTAAATDTALTTQIARIGTNPATTSTTTVTNDTIVATQTYTTIAGGEAITEAGLFFSNSGAMFCSTTFTGADIKTLTEAGSQVALTYNIKFA